MKLSKKGKIIIFSFGMFLALVTFFSLALFIKPLTFSLKGDKNTRLLLNTNYRETGIIAKKCNLFKCQDLTKDVTITNNIKTDKIGSYNVTYVLKINKKTYKLNREVFVYENTIPVITLNGNVDIHVCPGKVYEEEGYTATDEYDGDLTSKVKIKKTTDKIIYTVVDASQNKDEKYRTIKYEDNEKPTLNLKGNADIYLEKGKTFTDPGATALDNCDGDLTNQVKIEGTVKNDEVGTYTLTYTINDTFGNTTSITRNVHVYSFDKTSIDNYTNSLESYIKEKNYQVSIGYYNINKDYTYTYNADKVYYGASLVKTLDALYVYEKMTLTDELKALVKPTIEKSDNNTHRKLVNIIGFNNLKEYGKSLGAKYALTRSNTDYYGNTIVADQIAYMKYLYNFINNESIPQEKREELKNYFINDFYKYLKFENAPTIMHKYGYYSVYYHDVGIVLDKNPYIVVILSEEATHDFKIITDLSEKIYELHKLV